MYSRYCRFFIEDSPIRQAYREAIHSAHSSGFDSTKWILDSIKWDLDFASADSAFRLFVNYYGTRTATRENFETILKEMDDHFRSQNPPSLPDYAIDEILRYPQNPPKFRPGSNQRVDLPRPIVNYILKSSSHRILQKLYATSKQFYSMFKVVVCYRLEAGSPNPYKAYPCQESLLFSPNFELETLPKLYLTNFLILGSCIKGSLASKIISKIYKCEVTHLSLNNQNLSAEEFKILAAHLVVLHFNRSHISQANNLQIFDASVDTIIKLAPCIKILKVNGFRFPLNIPVGHFPRWQKSMEQIGPFILVPI